MTQESYSLQVGTKGEDRLEILNQLYNPKTQDFLINNGLTSAKTILEVGCGTGIIACWLAKQAPNANVVAIDTSEEQLEITKIRAKNLGLKNLKCEQLSIYDLSELKEQFDFAYCRWLLVHLIEPQKGLQAIYDVVKPGGIIACEDIDLGSFFSHPKSEVLQHFTIAHLDLFYAENKNPRIANELYGYFKNLGSKNIKTSISQPVLKSFEEKNIRCMALEELKAAFVRKKVMSENTFNNLLKDMRDFCQQDVFDVHAYNVLIAGEKPL